MLTVVVLALAMLARAQPTCVLHTDVVIGADSIDILKVANAGQCCSHCQDNIACVAFTFDTASGQCFLKDNARGNTPTPSRVSGTLDRPAPGEACTQLSDFPFCNTALTLDQRLDDLVGRIFLNESAPLLTARQSIAIPRLGLPSYYWGTNAIHGLQNVDCLPNGVCPTSFAAPCSLSAAFNDSLVADMGAILARELRAYYNGHYHNSLDTWSPTINVNRDPRWGRNVESPGEDPLVCGRYGTAYTKGLQEGPDSKYVQTVVTLKHWLAYSLENYDGVTRHTFNAVVSDYDLAATYLPAWSMTVQQGGALGVMCSYNEVNGVPTCASTHFTSVLRDQWGFQGYITSDSDAVGDIWSSHHYEPTAELAVRDALEAGCDIDSGNTYNNALQTAVEQKLVNESFVKAALRNTFRMRMRLGLFDTNVSSPYKNITTDVVGCKAHQESSLLGSRKGMVLLKNSANTLPFPRGKKVALIGVSSDVGGDLLGNYVGPVCPSGKTECVDSIYKQVVQFNSPGSVTLVSNVNNISGAIEAARQADYVILTASNAHDGGGEGQDRHNISLAQNQITLAKAVLQVGKPTVLLLINGGIIAIDDLAESAPAILEAFMPGFHGAQAIAETIFGLNNPGGKMPVTMYHSNYVNEVDFFNMSMQAGPGRSYRYYEGTPIFPFGFGLSYTTFELDWSPQPPPRTLLTDPDSNLVYTVKVTNTGPIEGDEVVLAYYAPSVATARTVDAPVPKKQLFDYQRITLAAGASTVLHFTTPARTLALANAAGDRMIYPGDYVIEFTRGHGAVLQADAVFSADGPLLAEKFPIKA